MSEATGSVHEIFKSYQGEGPTVGRRQLFVRMGGCSLRCRYCDTPGALVRRPFFEVEHGPGQRERHPNPVTASELRETLDRYDSQKLEIALTGGEPLDQAEFLEAFLPQVHGERGIYLETAGVHAEAMARLRPWVTTVAMDIKLDSMAHEGDRMAEHAAFLEAALGTGTRAGTGTRTRTGTDTDLFIKVIVSDAAHVDELEAAAQLVASFDPELTFVLQPETDRTTDRPSPLSRIDELFAGAARYLHDVRVIPQTHKFLGLP